MVWRGSVQAGDHTCHAVFDDQIRARYKVRPLSETDPARICITVTAEDGVTTRSYYINLYRNNDWPEFTIDRENVTNRTADSVTLRIHANIDGYLYYLPAYRGAYADIPAANEVKSQGQRIAIHAGDQVVTIPGLGKEECTLYLYEMSYAQRFSNGAQLDIAAYTGGDNPPDPRNTDSGRSESGWKNRYDGSVVDAGCPYCGQERRSDSGRSERGSCSRYDGCGDSDGSDHRSVIK